MKYFLLLINVAVMAECLLVQKNKNRIEGEWKYLYSKINGFELEEGYIYKLKVKEEKLENVPADASSIKYTLIEMLEKNVDKKLLLNGK